MPIYFLNLPVRAPFMFESVGNQWHQTDVTRPLGYPYYHYLQTEKGAGRVEVQGKQYLLNEQEGILLAPSIPHSYTGESGEWLTVFATFTGTLQSAIASMVRNRPVTFVSREQGLLIESVIRTAVKLHQAQVPDVKAISACCYNLLMEFTDCVTYQDPSENPLYQRYIIPVIKEIETHYAEELTARSLSDLVFVTPQYLSRLFQRFLGHSVYEYLTIYRIARAKELLLTHPHTKIQDISHAVGFTDASHFIAMFKKTTGRTPLEFRSMF